MNILDATVEVVSEVLKRRGLPDAVINTLFGNITLIVITIVVMYIFIYTKIIKNYIDGQSAILGCWFRVSAFSTTKCPENEKYENSSIT